MASSDSTCRYCGRDCGNPGGRTNHERACPDNPDNQAPRQEPRQPVRREAGGGAELARRDDTEAAPLERLGGGQGAGAALADLAYVLSAPDAPREARREAVNRSAGLAGGFINRWLDHRQDSIERSRERAQSAELARNTRYPECGDCGYQFTEAEIGPHTKSVKCPDCDSVWDVIVPDQAAEA